MLASCVGMLCCIVVVLRNYYRFRVNKIDYKLWDFRTITIDDYSVELKINESLFNIITNNGNVNTDRISFLQELKKIIQNKLKEVN
jgi:hypothetical protein